MKIRNIITDAATVVGCCVGVGFICGKELQLYIGNFENLLLFATVFFLLNLAVRFFCKGKNCFDLASFSRCCFGKFHTLFSTMFCLCSFVCVVTVLAGVQNCLNSQLVPLSLPVYSALTALISAFVLKRGIKALKILNIFAISTALLFLVLVAIFQKSICRQINVNAIQPLKYALFSVTMSVAVIAQLTSQNDKNIATTAVATSALALLAFIVMCLCDFSLPMPLVDRVDSLPLNILGAVTVVLCSVTGIVSNALPVTQAVSDVFDDDNLCIACFFVAALCFSMFGFDFALNQGYLFVVLVGLLTLIAMSVQGLKSVLRLKKLHKKSHSELAK